MQEEQIIKRPSFPQIKQQKMPRKLLKDTGSSLKGSTSQIAASHFGVARGLERNHLKKVQNSDSRGNWQGQRQPQAASTRQMGEVLPAWMSTQLPQLPVQYSSSCDIEALQAEDDHFFFRRKSSALEKQSEYSRQDETIPRFV